MLRTIVWLLIFYCSYNYFPLSQAGTLMRISMRFIPSALRGMIPSISVSSEQNGVSLCGSDFVTEKRDNKKTQISMLH